MKLRSSFVGLLTLALMAVAGCGGADEPTTASGGSGAPAGGSGLEKTTINIGTMPVVDTAPLQIAMEKGLFKAEGLEVKPSVLAGGAEAIPKLKGGSLDISFGNYVSFFSATAKGAIDLKIVSDGFQSAPKTHVIMVPKDSPIQTVADLKDKTIAVNTKRNISTMLIRVAGKAHNIELDEDKNFAEFPFPEMEGALKAGTVDAAQVVEPFGTFIAQNIGARVVWDTSQGPTADFPIAGYAATSEFVAANPKTVAAFQRAMSKAQELAADRANVVAVIPKYTKIPAAAAGSLAIGAFPTTLDATRLQRVADSMHEYGLLDAPIKAQDLIFAGR
ncbi:ABC transporter substrate-binding protein [Planomonospora parontospora]|uniref:ABC transporter substrate-binding protein n=1 Tax=Planomonospora parontospora TaxID=58119 RepID=UPI0019911985|nr:ABC transporter substrate-binding protein [Planomonospora parontospora]GGL31845.1 sulfonate ABC transporter substrate-binding protein [Planomonospora parontospora subsp. antibiotica]GII16861.1 sulfonate ABC transporter substrate-binding protein [Planomonospora parontospora subsp. antibiotica]